MISSGCIFVECGRGRAVAVHLYILHAAHRRQHLFSSPAATGQENLPPLTSTSDISQSVVNSLIMSSLACSIKPL